MRTVSDDSVVRLYYLGDDMGGGASTVMYGSLSVALARAAEQPADIQAGLFLQTRNDVVSYLDFIES